MTLSGLSYRWEWEGDKGIWQQYPIDVQEEISQGFNNGHKEVTINQTEEVSMIIKFSNMIQINQKTKFIRRIRICIEMKGHNGFFVYEYQKENQKWFVYNVQIMIQIAHAIENDQNLVSINYDNQSYEIDLEELTETNTETQTIRKIHPLKSSRLKTSSFFYLSFFSGKITIECLYNIE